MKNNYSPKHGRYSYHASFSTPLLNRGTRRQPHKRWGTREWLFTASIIVPAGIAVYKCWRKETSKKKEQERDIENKLIAINKTSEARLREMDKAHHHKMTEIERNHMNDLEKLDKEFENFCKKEEFRELHSREGQSEVDYDHPSESIPDTINKPDRVRRFKYIQDTPLTFGDLACLYSIPGLGKSILANGMLIGAASGMPSGLGCYSHEETPPMYALLYDAEQTDEDIQVRYGVNNAVLPNIERVSDCNFDDNPMLLVKDIQRKVWAKKQNAIVCIDNTSKMFPTIQAKVVSKTIKALEKLQEYAKEDGFSLTVLLVSHSVKDPKKSKSVANMSGSANWSRFAKTVISLSALSDENNAYKVMKIEKNRRGKQGEEFILRMEEKPYLHFVNDAEATANHIQEKPSNDGFKGWPNQIRGVSRQLAVEIADAYIPRKNGAGSLYKHFQNRPGVKNGKQIQRIIKDVGRLRAKHQSE